MKIIVAGSGTNVGKTVVSAILSLILQADYWKPIECGSSDTKTIKKWIAPSKVHRPIYSFKAPFSPHHAARLENQTIQVDQITPPITAKPLIIESVGGIFVPLTTKILTIDLFASWHFSWILVSKHYLGSINHTLLTVQALKERNISLLGIIFNGTPNPDSETAILENSHIPFLGRLLPERINLKTLQRYAKQWQFL